VIVDAGVGSASDVSVAMELGADGVLLNTADRPRQDPVMMAHAMRKRVRSGPPELPRGADREEALRDGEQPDGGGDQLYSGGVSYEAMAEPATLRTAEFDPKVKTYYMVSTIIISVVTIIGIPLLLIIIPLGFVLIQKMLDNLSCVLTDRTLEIKRGVLSKTESTIPLEKITDLQMYQGPIMRYFGAARVRVETAWSDGARRS
jgi:hypothetical protein